MYKSKLVSRPSSGMNHSPQQIARTIAEVERIQERVFWVLHPECGAPGMLIMTPNGEPVLPAKETSFLPSVIQSRLPKGPASAEPTNRAPTPEAKLLSPPPNVASNRPKLAETTPSLATNVLHVKQFFRIPEKRFLRRYAIPSEPSNAGRLDRAMVVGHRVCGGKLWLAVSFQEQESNLAYPQLHYRVAAAILDPKDGTWEIVEFPQEDNPFTRSEVRGVRVPERSLNIGAFGNALFVSAWPEQISRYDLATHHWDRLQIPVEKASRIFAIADHLYAANDECIVELLNKGEGTRVLASCRRRPVKSTLDALESLGEVVLFPGPGNSVRAGVGNKVFSWNGEDWTQTLAFPSAGSLEVFDDGTLMRSVIENDRSDLWLLPHGDTNAELCVHEEYDYLGRRLTLSNGLSKLRPKPPADPKWPRSA